MEKSWGRREKPPWRGLAAPPRPGDQANTSGDTSGGKHMPWTQHDRVTGASGLHLPDTHRPDQSQGKPQTNPPEGLSTQSLMTLKAGHLIQNKGQLRKTATVWRNPTNMTPEFKCRLSHAGSWVTRRTLLWTEYLCPPQPHLNSYTWLPSQLSW